MALAWPTDNSPNRGQNREYLWHTRVHLGAGQWAWGQGSLALTAAVRVWGGIPECTWSPLYTPATQWARAGWDCFSELTLPLGESLVEAASEPMSKKPKVKECHFHSFTSSYELIPVSIQMLKGQLTVALNQHYQYHGWLLLQGVRPSWHPLGFSI
jgi:hypothetical protein